MTKRTRVLALAVLAGLPAFGPGAEPARVPANQAALAGNAFGFDLYRQLAKEQPGKTLFFSPYSVESALSIVAEGARGQTAQEMGKVLRFPPATRRLGAGAAERPWDVGPVLADFAMLNRRFEAAGVPPTRAVLERITALRKDLAANNREAERLHNDAAFINAQRTADELNKLLRQVDRYDLRVANALWGEKTYPFKQSFLDAINKPFRTGAAFPVDFRNNVEAARKEINAWVDKRTNGRIKDLVGPRALTRETRLVVTNAIYFKGEWAEPFAPGATSKQPFTLADGTKVEAPLMARLSLTGGRYGAFNKDGSSFATPARVRLGEADPAKLYPALDGFVVVELPYKGGDLSLVAIAPRSPGGLPAVEKLLSEANVKAWLRDLQARPVNVYLPKFKVETEYTLKDPLEALGMKEAFKEPPGKGTANFQGMTDSPATKDKLFVSKVLHKAFVEVSEKGTEAAAATAVVMARPTAVALSSPFTPTFRADRPFVFLIRDRQSGAILFLGRLAKP
jgi:serine protease inhibitor